MSHVGAFPDPEPIRLLTVKLVGLSVVDVGEKSSKKSKSCAREFEVVGHGSAVSVLS